MKSTSKLPPFVLADWYKNDLVLTKKETGAKGALKREKETKNKLAIKQLGDNKKNVTVIIKDSEVAFLSEEEFSLLSNILKACNLTMADIALVNWAQTPARYTDIKKQFSPSHLLLFDVSTADVELPFSIPAYQLQTYDRCQLLVAAPLRMMLGETMKAKEEKNKLWHALKKMFLSSTQ